MKFTKKSKIVIMVICVASILCIVALACGHEVEGLIHHKYLRSIYEWRSPDYYRCTGQVEIPIMQCQVCGDTCRGEEIDNRPEHVLDYSYYTYGQCEECGYVRAHS